jgi:flagellar protein FliS
MNGFPSPQSTARYLDARASTASQPELQLMLLDGAVRFGRQALEHIVDPGRTAQALSLLSRMIDVVEELVRSVALGTTEASKRLEEEYAFAFRQLAAAHLNRDAAALQSALSLLEFHRETWRQACDRLKAAAPEPASSESAPPAGLAANRGVPSPSGGGGPQGGSVLFEA